MELGKLISAESPTFRLADHFFKFVCFFFLTSILSFFSEPDQPLPTQERVQITGAMQAKSYPIHLAGQCKIMQIPKVLQGNGIFSVYSILGCFPQMLFLLFVLRFYVLGCLGILMSNRSHHTS